MKTNNIIYFALAVIMGMSVASCADGDEPNPGKEESGLFANMAKSDDGSLVLYPAFHKIESAPTSNATIYVEADTWWIDEVIVDDVHYLASDYAKTEPYKFFNKYSEGFTVTTYRSLKEWDEEKQDMIEVQIDKDFIPESCSRIEVVVATASGKCSAVINIEKSSESVANDNSSFLGDNVDFVASKEGGTKTYRIYSQWWGVSSVTLDGEQVLMPGNEEDNCWFAGDTKEYGWITVKHGMGIMQITIAPNDGARRSFEVVAKTPEEIAYPTMCVRCTQLGVDD